MQDIYDDAFNEVHRSNMAKLVDGKVIRRDDGKVLKPEGGNHRNWPSLSNDSVELFLEPLRDVMSRPVALVTGGGQGIGAATCARLASDGYDVLLTYNTSSKPAEMVIHQIRQDGGDALAVKVDCANEGEVGLHGIHPWMARKIDVLVLNHGGIIALLLIN